VILGSLALNPLYYVIGVTGSGKTTLAMKHAINHPTTNFFIALPSIQAIDEKANELFDLLDSAGVKRPVKRFYSRQGQEMSVVEQIARHVEATPRDAGSIIFITHRAFAGTVSSMRFPASAIRSVNHCRTIGIYCSISCT
jgi:hypothetical protein